MHITVKAKDLQVGDTCLGSGMRITSKELHPSGKLVTVGVIYSNGVSVRRMWRPITTIKVDRPIDMESMREHIVEAMCGDAVYDRVQALRTLDMYVAEAVLKG